MGVKRGLGKGLEALIPGSEDRSLNLAGVLQVRLNNIIPNPRQPRTNIDSSQLKGLTQSITKHGILQPLIVAQVDKSERYQLIAGERRWQAAKLAGLAMVPVIVRQADGLDQLSLALVENMQRSDLNPLEAAEGYRQLAEDFQLSHEAIALIIGKSRAEITNTMRLLKLSASVRKALAAQKISQGHARTLLALSTAQAQSAALQTILRGELNVRQTEELVRRLGGESKRRDPSSPRSPELIDLEEKLRQSLGTRVTLKHGSRGGSILIRFYSDEELDALVRRLVEDA
ncbi:MAG: ParB/RepB/Spo0J family partition protein [Chloroflexi bacterium]|nr:ParB/RepB/Spo0J family partition protein [Chloroflexota bacterium]